MVGVAVNVALLPAQILVVPVAILTVGTTDGFTVIVMELDVAVAGDGQVAVDVITQVTDCPLVSVVVVKVALFVPALVPFTFH